MTGINPTSGVSPLSIVSGASAPDARALAASTMNEIGGRVLAWVGAVGGGRSTGASGFTPDLRELTRGGDVYGLGQLASDITDRVGGTPMQQGDLRRALEGFTREAVIQIAGLAGAPGERRMAGVDSAVAAAIDGPGGAGVDGVIGRLDAAASRLGAQNGR